MAIPRHRARGGVRYRALAVTAVLATTPWALVTLGVPAASAADGSISVAPTTLVFPDTYVGASSAQLSVILTNVGSTTVVPSLAGGALIERTDFASDGQTCGTLAPGDSCAFRYHFAPTRTGPLTDRTTIGVNGTNYPILLSGKGIASFTVSPTTLVFPDTVVGSSTPMQSVVLTNISSTALHPALAGGALIGRTDFASDGQTCGVVPPGGTCAFRYHFAPTTLGDLTDHTTIGVDGTNYPITVTGTGITGVDVTPTTLRFPDTAVGTQSAPLVVTLTNITSQVLHPGIGGGSLTTGTDFVYDGEDCPDSLGPGQACRASYAFAPTSAGPHTDTATLMVSGTTVTITLLGGPDTTPTTTTATTTTSTSATTATTHHGSTTQHGGSTTQHGSTPTHHTSTPRTSMHHSTAASPHTAALGTHAPTSRRTTGDSASATSASTASDSAADDSAVSSVTASSAGPAGSAVSQTGTTSRGSGPASSVALLSANPSTGGSAWPYVWIAIGVVAVAAAGAGGYLLARRRRV